MGQKNDRPDLVVVLGAGSSIPCGLPSTLQLSEIAIQAFRETYSAHAAGFRNDEDSAREGRRLADLVIGGLKKVYPEDFGFELLLHATRSLDAFVAVGQGAIGGQPASYRPIASVFASVLPEFAPALQAHILHGAFFAMMKAMHLQVGVAEAARSDEHKAATDQTQAFLRACAARFRLIVIDLNYDAVADDAGIEWLDGFVARIDHAPYRVFNAAAWRRDQHTKNLLLHLHGSSRFGYADEEWHHHTSPWQPVHYAKAATANASLKMTGSAATLIGGMDQGAYALISGIDKAGNIVYNPEPYGHYHLAAADALCRANRLLVIGFGGRDPHLNAWIGEHAEIHGDDRRAVMIGPYPWEWQGQHRRGENVLLRLLVGRQRWTEANGVLSGWKMNVCHMGPLELDLAGAPDAYANADRILDYLGG